METAKYGNLHKLFDENFIDYTSYVIRERAIPDLADGLKPVQRRILQTLHNVDDGRFHKVANVVGETMKLHPHGDASIFSALVNLANKGYLVDRQGNFGNIYTGDSASAARYIECRLTPLARETMFNRELTEFTDSYDGRMKEPVSLPAKLPLLLLQGAEGIAVGMATKIMPHNFCELLQAQKKILQGEEFAVYPDFYQGGLLDVSAYDDGNGRLRCRARIEEKDDKTIIIREIPFGTNTQGLIESVEKAARAGKFKILSINDYTAEEVEIEIKLARGLKAEETIKALYAFTDCELAISPNFTVIRDRNPVILSVSEVLRENTSRLYNLLEKELQLELARLKERLQAHQLERIFIEERLYKQIEECPSFELVIKTIDEALKPYTAELVRPVSREDIEKLLEIKIKRISRYDIERKKKEIKATLRQIKEVEKNLRDMTGYCIRFLDDLLARYGGDYPRRTELTTFAGVQASQVALSNLTIGYDRESGFFGTQVKAGADNSLACSEYDKILLIDKSGWYKVINVPEKIFIGHDLLWWGRVADRQTFNMVYRDGKQNLCYLKRFVTPKFIVDKEYRLFAEQRRSEIIFLKTGEGVNIRAHLSPSPRTRRNREVFRCDDFLIKGAAAIGKRLSPRPIRRVEEVSDAVAAKAEEEKNPQAPLFNKE
ncbi:DNA topoisomerase IV subunit A [Desulfurivibrio alkaliphilus]|uniref:DNA topoisomerase (ATP-hydrolyzing) n=1 Tax=Desulfurivibrio alkaliphilus (strain DSM 19089 / UNIQEM U267 / AHT2) TaxID=589865 RepID=D6Z291_DESAT|nr:DNA topoisomerase IV subunit A [Desulfurivibrio alkaliphilus]ADH85666.1 DNA topoisomerase (ATP-hydrolyzing) [Desulfurivibrio alkaliphilus AHT 2]